MAGRVPPFLGLWEKDLLAQEGNFFCGKSCGQGLSPDSDGHVHPRVILTPPNREHVHVIQCTLLYLYANSVPPRKRESSCWALVMS